MIGAHTAFMLRQRFSGTWAFIHINKCGGSSIERVTGIPRLHDKALQRRKSVGEARWNAMFTFSVVRDPYERVASLYRYRVKNDRAGLGDGRLGFDDWVQAALVDRNPRYYDKPLMFAPARQWISNEAGEIMVDLVVKLENIELAWPAIAARIGAPPVMSHENRTEREGAPAMSDVSRETIARIYAADFVSFGYDP